MVNGIEASCLNKLGMHQTEWGLDTTSDRYRINNNQRILGNLLPKE